MKKSIKLVGLSFLAIAITISSCSKKTQEQAKETKDAAINDINTAAGAAKSGVDDIATDTKSGVQDVATDIKNGAHGVATDIKDAAVSAKSTIDAKVSKLSASAKAQYDSFDSEVKRLDQEISKASSLQKAKLEKTRDAMVKKRDDLLGK